jgi:hypothetical protein
MSPATGGTLRLAWLPWLLFLALTAGEDLLILRVPCLDHGLPNNDALDYVPRARTLLETGAFPADEEGDAWRPPGYATLLAGLMVLAGDSNAAISTSGRLLNLLVDLALGCFLLWLACRCLAGTWLRLGAALLLGVQPWTAAWAPILAPDLLCAGLFVAGLVTLARAATGRHSVAWLLAGSALTSACFLLRAEFILLVPLPVALALLLRRPTPLRFLLLTVLATLPFLAAVGANVAYRQHVAGRTEVFGMYRLRAPGLSLWVGTWYGRGEQKHGIVNGWPGGSLYVRAEDLPDGAFATPAERERVLGLFRQIEADGTVSPVVDRTFGELAVSRIEADPWRYYLGVRLWNAPRYWISLGEPRTVTGLAFRHLQSAESNLLGALAYLALQAIVLLAALLGVGRALVRGGRRQADWIDRFLLLGLVFILQRTIFFAFWNPFVELRYMMPAWPCLFALAVCGAGRRHETS